LEQRFQEEENYSLSEDKLQEYATDSESEEDFALAGGIYPDDDMIWENDSLRRDDMLSKVSEKPEAFTKDVSKVSRKELSSKSTRKEGTRKENKRTIDGRKGLAPTW